MSINALHLLSVFSCLILYWIPTAAAENRNVNRIDLKNISYYEAVNYNVEEVHRQHLIADELSNSSYVFIRFSALQRNFRLSLERHKSLFLGSAEFHVLSDELDDTTSYDVKTVYTGTVEGDPESFVMGHILEGQFDGSFFAFGETFHLEPSKRYFSSPMSFHSIIFPASSVEFDFGRIQRTTARFKDQKRLLTQKHPFVLERRRRSNLNSSNLNTCAVHIAADHLFVKHVGGGSERATVAEMVYHTGMADKLFRATDFNQDGGPGDDIGFVIAAVTVFQDEKAEGSLASPENIEIMPYLVKWSEIDHNSYCLALLFTYRDFEEGALGLAWVAEPDPATPGGICSKRVLFEEENEAISFNAALVSFENFGSMVPRKASVITVTHEFGHSFGASHDPDTAECSPGGRAGNYAMYSRASDGNEPNNFLFSPCSKRQISPIILIKRHQCFIAHNNGSYCGNKIVEEGEECDCGRPEECDEVDTCCVARDDTQNIPGCTIRPGKHCSGVAGTCCTDDCEFIPESQAHVCQEETECRLSVTCNGENGRCPSAEIRPRNVTCNGGANTCFEGACIGSICALYGFNECECQGNRQELCHVCCNSSEAACTSANQLLGRVILKRPGSTCKQHSGYCDSSGQCVIVDDDNELNKLEEAFKRIFSQATMNDMWAWIKEHWYYVLAVLAGLCLVLVVLKVTYGRRTSLLILARSAMMPYALRHHRAQMPHLPTRGRANLLGGMDGQLQGGITIRRQRREPEDLQTRLQSLFPDASSQALFSAIRHSTSEQSAIERLQAQGYTMIDQQAV